MALADDLWSEGHVRIPHRLMRSHWWHSLTVGQRSVVMSLWELANYEEGEFAYGSPPVRVVVGEGETACSLETIAREARVTVKVVRTTIARMLLGAVSEGIGPMLSERKVIASGRGPRILRIEHYRKKQDATGSRGTPSGTTAVRKWAQAGHDRGTIRAPIEGIEKGNKGRTEEELPSHATGPDVPLSHSEVGEADFGLQSLSKASGDRRARRNGFDVAAIEQLRRAMLTVYEDQRGQAYAEDRGRDTRAIRKLLSYPDASSDRILSAWRRGLQGHGWLRCEVLSELADQRRWTEHSHRPLRGHEPSVALTEAKPVDRGPGGTTVAPISLSASGVAPEPKHRAATLEEVRRIMQRHREVSRRAEGRNADSGTQVHPGTATPVVLSTACGHGAGVDDRSHEGANA